jgi:competence protein ComEA
LSDGQKIVVPVKNAGNQQMEKEAVEDGLISINQADLNQLMTLPGIGEVKAQAILEYRTQHGGFSSIEEIRQVNGIGESIFSQIKNKIKI